MVQVGRPVPIQPQPHGHSRWAWSLPTQAEGDAQGSGFKVWRIFRFLGDGGVLWVGRVEGPDRFEGWVGFGGVFIFRTGGGLLVVCRVYGIARSQWYPSEGSCTCGPTTIATTLNNGS